MVDGGDPHVDWREVVEAVPGSVGVLVDGAFVHVSEPFATTVGTGVNALVGEPWRSLFGPEEATRLEREALGAVRTDGRWEGRVRPRDCERPVDLVLSATDGGAVVWHASECDPDSAPPDPETAGADADWDREQERYDRILETVDDGVYATDEELRITFANDRFAELFGLSVEEVVGTDPRELYEDAAELEAADETRERLLETGERTGTITGTFTTPDGERVLEARYRLAPGTDGEFQGSVGVVRDVTELRRLERELREERRFVETVVDALDDVLYVVDEEETFSFWNEELCERFGYDDEEVAALDPETFLTGSGSDQLSEESSTVVDVPDRHSVVDLVTSDGDAIPHELHGVTYEDETTGERYRVGIARDITDRLARERAIERQRDELATLDRINELLLDTVRELIQTASREAVERAVCKRLAASDLYRFAWVGERALDGDRIVPRITAGEDDGYLDAVTITADGSETGMGPAGRAIETGEVQVATVDEPAFEPWRDAATERGVEAVAGVPLQHEGTVYGVLVVYATREQAFSRREQDGFDVLGRTVGFVIHATRSRELLFSDTVLELEFRIAGTDSPLVSVATELDCELTLRGYVPVDEGWMLYLSVDGASPDSVVARATEDPRVGRGRVVSEAGTNGRIEFVVAPSSLLHAVTDAGATVRSAVAGADDSRIRIEAPVDADAREIVERVRAEFPEANLSARRERDRGAATGGRPAGLLADLTERQREALGAAYHGGYFEWPRESTAEEVADSLGLAAPTLHGHLRRAEATILSALLEDAVPPDCPDP